jgi:hypothetical protein
VRHANSHRHTAGESLWIPIPPPCVSITSPGFSRSHRSTFGGKVFGTSAIVASPEPCGMCKIHTLRDLLSPDPTDLTRPQRLENIPNRRACNELRLVASNRSRHAWITPSSIDTLLPR